jgi:hypothetical protein
MKTIDDVRREREQLRQQRPDVGPLADFPGIREAALVGAKAHAEAAARPLTFVWEDRACPGNVVLVGGAPGAGKTTAFKLLIAARCNRTRERVSVLGGEMKSADPDKFVLFVEAEEGEASAARGLERARAMLGLPDDTFARLVTIARKEVTAGSARWLEIVELCRRGHVDSIWIDSLARFQAEDANSEQQAEVFAEVQSAIEGAPSTEKPTTWMICHSRKNGGDDIADIAGSVQRAAQADVVAILTADKDDDGQNVSATLKFLKIRETGDTWPKASSFSIAKGEDGGWRVAWGERSARADDQPAHERVYSLLQKGGQRTKNEIREALGLNAKRLEQALTTLFSERRIKKSKITVRGTEREVFMAKLDRDALFKEMATAPDEEPAPFAIGGVGPDGF